MFPLGSLLPVFLVCVCVCETERHVSLGAYLPMEERGNNGGIQTAGERKGERGRE